MRATDNIQSGVVRKNVALSVLKPCFIKDGRSLLRIVKSHVVCILSDGHVCQIYMKGKRTPILLYDTFKKLTEKFSDILITIHRGTAVNMQYATAIENGAVTLAWDDNERDFSYSAEGYNRILEAIDILK